jgi:hypothetical protein
MDEQGGDTFDNVAGIDTDGTPVYRDTDDDKACPEGEPLLVEVEASSPLEHLLAHVIDAQARTIEAQHATIDWLVRRALRDEKPPAQPEVASASLVATRSEGATRMNLKDAGEQVAWSVAEYDASGATIPQDTGTATWASTDDTVLVVSPSDDGYSAIGTLAAGVAPGATAGVTCSLDVGRTKDDGSGNQVPDPIELADSILVVSGDVATAALVGTVEPTA